MRRLAAISCHLLCVLATSLAIGGTSNAATKGTDVPAMTAPPPRAGLEKSKKSATKLAYPRFRKKTPYAAAREKLVASGWQPVISADADPCMAGDTRCEGRPEMEACAGTGEGNCLFVWRKNNTMIAVTTYDDPPLVASIQCRSGCRR
jgi:hypothetical protein